MRKSLLEWRTKWERSEGTKINPSYRGSFGKALELLCEYASISPTAEFKFGISHGVVRFFSGRWLSHHDNLVHDALEPYLSGTKSFSAVPHVKELLELIKIALKAKDVTLDRKGDLWKIFTVIAEKTGVDFKTINVDYAFRPTDTLGI